MSLYAADILSLSAYLERYRLKDEPALVIPDAPDLTHRQLIDRVKCLATVFMDSPCEDWVLSCNESQHFIEGFLALVLAGKQLWLPANGQPGTLADICHHAQVLCTDGIGDSFFGETVHLATVDEPATEYVDSSLFCPEKAGIVFMTSGSSGQPKAVHKTLFQLEAEINTLEALWGRIVEHATVLSCVSHQHIYGVLFRMLWPLLAGRPVHTAQFEYPENLLAEIQQHDQSVVVASPAQIERLSEDLSCEHCRTRVSAVFSSGALLSSEGAELGQRCLGRLPFEVFGSTETGGVGWRVQIPGNRSPSSWTPFPGVRVTIHDELLNITSSWVTPKSQMQAMGDRAELLEDGRFLLHGRADRIAKIEGKRVSLALVAQSLRESALVRDAEVVVIDGHRRQLGAVVALTENGRERLKREGRLAMSRALRQQLSRHLEAVTLPRRWRYPAEIPVNSQGKIVRVVLEQLFCENEPELQERTGHE